MYETYKEYVKHQLEWTGHFENDLQLAKKILDGEVKVGNGKATVAVCILLDTFIHPLPVTDHVRKALGYNYAKSLRLSCSSLKYKDWILGSRLCSYLSLDTFRDVYFSRKAHLGNRRYKDYSLSGPLFTYFRFYRKLPPKEFQAEILRLLGSKSKYGKAYAISILGTLHPVRDEYLAVIERALKSETLFYEGYVTECVQHWLYTKRIKKITSRHLLKLRAILIKSFTRKADLKWLLEKLNHELTRRGVR